MSGKQQVEENRLITMGGNLNIGLILRPGNLRGCVYIKKLKNLPKSTRAVAI
jgi:hypothetical protein